ncbi:MAG: hypothetical protein LUD78_05850 [Clostridiales bacterium]|nr:hypothetical protein [Clostridiales bacterium]
MKRLISLFLSAALCLALAGCASSEKQELKAAMDEANGYTTVDYTMDVGVTREQTVIYDENGIMVTALGVQGSTDSCRLWLRLENSTGDEVTLWSSSVQANGWELDSVLWMNVSKNSMGREYVSFYPEDAGMELDSIQTITLTCELWDDNYNTIDAFTATLETSAYTGELADEELPGDVLYEGNGVTLTFGGLKQERYSSYGKLQFYAENTGSKSVTLDGDAFRLSDGQEMAATLYETVSAGAKKAFYIYIDQDDIYDPETEEYYDSYDWEEETFDWTVLMPFTMDLTVYKGYSEVLDEATITIDTAVELVDEDEAADWGEETVTATDDTDTATEEPVQEDAAIATDEGETAAEEETTAVTDDTDTAAADEGDAIVEAQEETDTATTEDVRTA